MPQMAMVWATPGVSRDFIDLGHDLLGAIQRSRVGKLDTGQASAHVLLRYEAGRSAVEQPPSEDQQAGIAHQHEGGQMHRLADAPPVGPRQGFKEAIEAAKNPAERRVHRANDEPAQDPAGQRQV